MKVKFVPQEVEFEIKPGQTVMDLAHEKGIPVRSTCNGMPSCAECRVRVTDGDWNVNPPSRKELSLIGTGYYIDQRRLSCQILCFGDITVDTTEQIEKEAEGPVTKKFLTKVHKESAEKSHSLGGVMLEESGQLIAELKEGIPDQPEPLTQAGLTEYTARGGRGGRGSERGGRGGGRTAQNGRPQPARGAHPQRNGGSQVQVSRDGGGGASAGLRSEGQGGRRRRRGGRGRGGGRGSQGGGGSSAGG